MLKVYYFAFEAGVFAAGAGFLGKMSGYVYDSFNIYGSILCIIGMIIMNAAMWALFSKSLNLSSTSVTPTVISAATNYLLSGIIGVIIFQESTSLLWWSGIGLVLIGLLLLTRGKSNDSKEHAT